MADFCKQCSEELFEESYSDLEGLCDREYQIQILCEGCGLTLVDYRGECQGGCMKAKAHARKEDV